MVFSDLKGSLLRRQPRAWGTLVTVRFASPILTALMLWVQRLNAFSQLHRQKCVIRIHRLWETLEQKKRFMDSSNHDGSFVRRQPGAWGTLVIVTGCPAAVARSGLCCSKLFHKF